jgi:hypothetical protein
MGKRNIGAFRSELCHHKLREAMASTNQTPSTEQENKSAGASLVAAALEDPEVSSDKAALEQKLANATPEEMEGAQAFTDMFLAKMAATFEQYGEICREHCNAVVDHKAATLRREMAEQASAAANEANAAVKTTLAITKELLALRKELEEMRKETASRIETLQNVMWNNDQVSAKSTHNVLAALRAELEQVKERAAQDAKEMGKRLHAMTGSLESQLSSLRGELDLVKERATADQQERS